MTKEELLKELMNCRNELCLKCGAYRDSHLGACDGCRYNSDHIKKWEDELNARIYFKRQSINRR